MTKDNQNESLSQELSCDEQEPFHVVLVDIEKAAKYQIKCISTPLEDPDLNFVALSYRWGECQEQSMDTGVGYTANITSFDLEHFYQLCDMIRLDVDMKQIKYVWVDAICVDQVNRERRKATIHHMSNIYDRASWIIAVPDLHLDYLKNVSQHNDMNIQNTMYYQRDIYHLLHGNTEKMTLIEKEYLDMWFVPDELQDLLTSSTDCFLGGLMQAGKNTTPYHTQDVLYHIFKTYRVRKSESSYLASRIINKGLEYLRQEAVCDLKTCPLKHHCQSTRCPFDPHTKDGSNNWYSSEDDECDYQFIRRIVDRITRIRQSVNFLKDLIKDWSSRVWVISEYSIAKRKNNLKYWFIQLKMVQDLTTRRIDHDNDLVFAFFTFDFHNTGVFNTIQDGYQENNFYALKKVDNDPVYLTFHHRMINQLDQQSFFEMMLKSKASRNEDRFYSIFPLSKYKDKIINKAEVDSWKIDTFVSVRIQLFNIMDTVDKLTLLYLSIGNPSAKLVGHLMPTFATSTLHWDEKKEDLFTPLDDHVKYNFDFMDTTTITLIQNKYLNLKPKEYYVYFIGKHHVEEGTFSSDILEYYKYKWNDILQNIPTPKTIVCIPAIMGNQGNRPICLMGDFKHNVWIAVGANTDFYFDHWECQKLSDHNTGFNIY